MLRKEQLLLVAAGLLYGWYPAFAIEEQVTLETKAGALFGTLDLPERPGPFPAVLIIAGSGPTDRDGNQPGLRNDSLKLLGRALAERNIAALRFDKRNVGESATSALSEEDLRFEDLASDAAAWIALLRRDRRVRGIGVIGHSEGSLIGMLAAKQASTDAFVSLEGPGRRADAVLREQIGRTLAPELRVAGNRILSELSAGRTIKNIPGNLMFLFRPSVQPYLISWFKYDPAVEIAGLRIPVLIVQGTTDTQVSVEDARRLATAGKNARLRLIDGMNHMLRRVATEAGQRASFTDPSMPIDVRAVDAITAFLAAEVRLRPEREGLGRRDRPESEASQTLKQLEPSGVPVR